MYSFPNDTLESGFDEGGSVELYDRLPDWLDEDYSTSGIDEADQPTADIIFQLRRILDPTGRYSSGEVNIRDGQGRAVHGPQSRRGSRVDLHLHRPGGPHMNVELDLDSRRQERHRRRHLVDMQAAYNAWIQRGMTGPNPLLNQASIFVMAAAPQGREGVGRITEVEQVQYRAGPDGRTVVALPIPSHSRDLGRMKPQTVARRFRSLFETLGRPPGLVGTMISPSRRRLRRLVGGPVRRWLRGAGTSGRRFDAIDDFLDQDAFIDDLMDELEGEADYGISLPCVYGRWCGPACSGPGEPIDAVDRCCRTHDNCYGQRGYFACSCDRDLVRCLNPHRGFWISRGRAASVISSYFSRAPCRIGA